MGSACRSTFCLDSLSAPDLSPSPALWMLSLSPNSAWAGSDTYRTQVGGGGGQGGQEGRS